METNLLLESHLKTLRLVTFREQYRQVAEDAAGNNLGYDQYLLALTEQGNGNMLTDKASNIILPYQ